MPKIPPRRASLVLCRADGTLLGRLPEVPCATPWWPDVGPVLDAVREAYGIEPVILRLLDTGRAAPHGGGVTYLAELDAELPVGAEAVLTAADVELDEQALRLPYARPGGPAQDLAWAEGALADAGLRREGPARQVRTWNLSSIWRLPLAGGTSAWLKIVPPFFAHEGAMLRLLQGTAPVPELIAAEGPRVLLADIPGEDRYDADPAELLRLVFGLVRLQGDWIGREAELEAAGLPDWRGPALAAKLSDLVASERESIPEPQRETLDRFVDTLPARMAAIADAGLPDTLVHGDFHPGNVRGDGTAFTILDWGDCGIGNPLLDLPSFLEVAPGSHVRRIRDAWTGAWQRRVLVADPARAAALLEPVAAARQALIYSTFLAGIEPVERRYHAADLPRWLKRTAQLVDREAASA